MKFRLKQTVMLIASALSLAVAYGTTAESVYGGSFGISPCLSGAIFKLNTDGTDFTNLF